MGTNSDFTRIAGKQGFREDAQFTLQEQKGNKMGQPEVVVLKTTEKMNPAWQLVKPIGLFALSVLSILGPVFVSKGVREGLYKHWVSVWEGAHSKFVKIDSSIGTSDEVKRLLAEQKAQGIETISLQAIKNVCGYLRIQKKMNAKEDNIQVDPNLAENPVLLKEIKASPTHQLVMREVNGKKHYFLMKKFEDLKARNGPNSVEERTLIKKPEQKKVFLTESLMQVQKNGGTLKVEQHQVHQLHKVTDPDVVAVAHKELTCSNGVQDVKLDSAVAMIKGSDKGQVGNPPKAMGEDAFVLDQVSIEVGNKKYEIPFAVTMDGGGGHTLAQYGRVHLKAAFEKHLKALIQEHGCIDSNLLASAMEKADEELFSQVNASGALFQGKGYRQVDVNHQIVFDEFGISAADFREFFKNYKTYQGETLGMNPMEMYKASGENFEKEITINGQKFDLSDKNIAEDLQYYYELAMGRRDLLPDGTFKYDITVNLVMNAYFLEDGKSVEEGGLQCVTYNRGDAMALVAHEDTTQAVSQRDKKSRSCVTLHRGDRTLGVCDGVTDPTSIDDLEFINKKPLYARNDVKFKDLSSEEYATTLLKGSKINGSKDDKTVVTLRVLR